MKSQIDNPYELLRRALENQIEQGLGEVIIDRKISLDELSLQSVSNDTMNGTSFKSVDDHRAAICECQLCPLGATRNKFVYGVGNPNADVLFIGEAPGAREDELGEPFVGRAGQLLDKILAAIEFSRQDVYIANILKCRPPGNRDPQSDEMESCFPYLKEQIKLIKPKLICALGRIAAQALMNTTTPLGKMRGKWHLYEGVPMMVTYHPAALLRFQSYKKDTWEDMKMLKARYDEMTR